MAGAKEIRSKIASIKNTQKITSAMEMVAASKMRKTQDRMRASKPYASKLYDVVKHVARAKAEYQHVFIQALTEDEAALEQHHIQKLVIKIFSAPGQCASHTWER